MQKIHICHHAQQETNLQIFLSPSYDDCDKDGLNTNVY